MLNTLLHGNHNARPNLRTHAVRSTATMTEERNQVQDGAPAPLHVCLRGVMWSSAELNSWRVWQQLATRSTVQLASRPDLRGVTAHSGIFEMARELEEAIRPHIVGQPGACDPLLQ
jgi:hypothetical protein